MTRHKIIACAVVILWALLHIGAEKHEATKPPPKGNPFRETMCEPVSYLSSVLLHQPICGLDSSDSTNPVTYNNGGYSTTGPEGDFAANASTVNTTSGASFQPPRNLRHSDQPAAELDSDVTVSEAVSSYLSLLRRGPNLFVEPQTDSSRALVLCRSQTDLDLSIQAHGSTNGFNCACPSAKKRDGLFFIQDLVGMLFPHATIQAVVTLLRFMRRRNDPRRLRQRRRRHAARRLAVAARQEPADNVYALRRALNEEYENIVNLQTELGETKEACVDLARAKSVLAQENDRFISDVRSSARKLHQALLGEQYAKESMVASRTELAEVRAKASSKQTTTAAEAQQVKERAATRIAELEREVADVRSEASHVRFNTRLFTDAWLRQQLEADQKAIEEKGEELASVTEALRIARNRTRMDAEVISDMSLTAKKTEDELRTTTDQRDKATIAARKAGKKVETLNAEVADTKAALEVSQTNASDAAESQRTTKSSADAALYSATVKACNQREHDAEIVRDISRQLHKTSKALIAAQEKEVEDATKIDKLARRERDIDVSYTSVISAATAAVNTAMIQRDEAAKESRVESQKAQARIAELEKKVRSIQAAAEPSSRSHAAEISAANDTIATVTMQRDELAQRYQEDAQNTHARITALEHELRSVHIVAKSAGNTASVLTVALVDPANHSNRAAPSATEHVRSWSYIYPKATEQVRSWSYTYPKNLLLTAAVRAKRSRPDEEGVNVSTVGSFGSVMGGGPVGQEEDASSLGAKKRRVDARLMATPVLQAPPSRIANFFRGGTDNNNGRSPGYTFKGVLAASDDWLERTHDCIQLIFPTRTPSRYSWEAPLVSDNDVQAFAADDRMKNRLLAALRRMLAFYGLEFTHNVDMEMVIEEGIKFKERCHDIKWLRPKNHNAKRLTRILECLRTFSLHRHADALRDCLLRITPSRHPSRVYWSNAGS